jgi:FkbM family methyltransferase
MAGSVKCQLGALTEACYRDPGGDRRQFGNGGLNHRIPLISYRGVRLRAVSAVVHRGYDCGILAPMLRKARRALALYLLRHERKAMVGRIFQRLETGTGVFRVPEFNGSFEIDLRSDLAERLMIDGHYEPKIVKTLPASIQGDAIDVGANIGFFSVYLSCVAKRVLSIEPLTTALLERNIQRNGCRNVLIERAAVGSAEATASISFVEGREEYSSLGAMVHDSIKTAKHERMDVRVTTIDALCERHNLSPGFIKIDVEGHEFQVLRGADKTITKHRPVILMEVSRKLLEANGSEPYDVFSFLEERGYSLLSIESGYTPIWAAFEGNVIARAHSVP